MMKISIKKLKQAGQNLKKAKRIAREILNDARTVHNEINEAIAENQKMILLQGNKDSAECWCVSVDGELLPAYCGLNIKKLQDDVRSWGLEKDGQVVRYEHVKLVRVK